MFNLTEGMKKELKRFLPMLMTTCILGIILISLKAFNSKSSNKELTIHAPIDRFIINQFPEENNDDLFQVDIPSIDGSSTFTAKFTTEELRKADTAIHEVLKYKIKDIPKGEVK